MDVTTHYIKTKIEAKLVNDRLKWSMLNYQIALV